MGKTDSYWEKDVTWNDVEAKASEEKEFAEGDIDIEEKGIKAYYPELLDEESGDLKYTQSLGTALIPDLLTSEKLLVDIYPKDTSDELIERIGVDLDFLETLAKKDLIKISASSDIANFEGNEELYPLLAHKDTIYRSTRTPCFYEQLSPGFEKERKERKEELSEYFSSLEKSQPDTLNEIYWAVPASNPPENVDSLSNVLSHWLERLAAVDKEEFDKIVEGFKENIVEKMPDLMQEQALKVFPDSTGLGGEMKIEAKMWPIFFGNSIPRPESLREGVARFKKIQDYIAEMCTNYTESDLTNRKIWENMKDASEKKLLDTLSDVSKRSEFIEVEGYLRRAFASPSGGDLTREEIRDYVDKLEGIVGTCETLLPGVIASSNMFGLVTQFGIGLFIERDKTLYNRIHNACKNRRVAESVFGSLRVVRILRREK